MTNMNASAGDWFYPGPAAQVLALAALALVFARHAMVGWELVGYGIAIMEGPREDGFPLLDLPASSLS